MADELNYLAGFGATHQTEAVACALPARGNSPQRPPLGLYAEQFSGSSFTMPRAQNLTSWLYRIRPTVGHGPFEPRPAGRLRTAPDTGGAPPAGPNPMRWDPLPFPETAADFVDGLVTLAVAGDAAAQSGSSVHLYAATRDMGRRAFYSADGHLLLVPQEGRLRLRTELGRLDVAPGEIAVVPRGTKLAVDLHDGRARGWVCEVHGAPFQLPDRGPIGSNSLASERHFRYPVAAFEDDDSAHEIVAKMGGHLFRADLDHSPFDVVAWHGNYAPYKYDLADFQAVGTVDRDHPDPSIFTVLTAPTAIPGLANVDFVIFPPRWMVAEDTFRPPYYHRNVMSELMGLVTGVYDAKEGGGFVPGGSSLHNCMAGHGPDALVFEKAREAALAPVKLDQTLAFMFESSLPFAVTDFGLHGGLLQADYLDCWRGLPKLFPGG
ncbi:MAG: homogentisate 1,2-dioxygenase [Myxococcales bacterium]|nr:homogentisate 1,2-dioxygenase [Myxococcales bacterium]